MANPKSAYSIPTKKGKLRFQVVIDASIDALRRTWMEERKQNAPQTSPSIGVVPASHSRPPAMSFDELSGAEDDDREEGSTQ